MAEDPRYLRNQSRAAHYRHRQNKRMLRWSMVLWLLGVAALTSAATADAIGKLGWGYATKDIWGGLLMLVFGCGFWVLATFVNYIVLAISRRIYGPEPSEPPER